MLIPLNWLKEYVDINTDTEEFCEKMVMSGSNIETLERFGVYDKVLMGLVKSVRPHENSDHLLITDVDVGAGEPVQIVTGADNVEAGMFVPVVLEGSVLPGGLKIKRGRLRGVDSYGMICSASELGFDDKVIPISHREGIWPIEGSYRIGADFADATGLADSVIDFEITPNRPDCLSLIGIARETAAVFGTKLMYPDTQIKSGHEKKASDFISVEIKEPSLCKRYAARVVTDVKIQQSPFWMQRKLMLAGIRPLNNIVDITNYVLLEYGQPIHAFDICSVEGARIIVDTAEDGQVFTTLDGTERVLNKATLMIKDASKPIAIAGVMGGLNSGILEDTETILIESACFSGDSVRLTSKRLGLRTEASSRFEKGIDPSLAYQAVNRVCALIEQLDAGRVTEGVVDVYPGQPERQAIQIRVDRTSKVLGDVISPEEIQSCLERLEMRVKIIDENTMSVLPPDIRLDLKIEEDLIEEVARIYGYNNLSMSIPKGNSQAGISQERALRDLCRDTLVALGYNEIQTYSFVSPSGIDKLRITDDAREREFVRPINPMGEENSVMRTMLLPGLMEVLGRNYSRKLESSAAFEIGLVFYPDEGNVLPFEQMSLSIGAYGAAMDFFGLKGAICELFIKLGITAEFKAKAEIPFYHPGRSAEIIVGGEVIGYIGEIHPDVSDAYGIDQRCFAGELNIQNISAVANISRTFSALPKYPPVDRDIALLVSEDTQVKSIEDVIRLAGERLIERVRLFDVYRGEQVPEGMKSAAFNLIYRSFNHTLTDEEVTLIHNRILKALKERIGAVLRDS